MVTRSCAFPNSRSAHSSRAVQASFQRLKRRARRAAQVRLRLLRRCALAVPRAPAREVVRVDVPDAVRTPAHAARRWRLRLDIIPAVRVIDRDPKSAERKPHARARTHAASRTLPATLLQTARAQPRPITFPFTNPSQSASRAKRPLLSLARPRTVPRCGRRLPGRLRRTLAALSPLLEWTLPKKTRKPRPPPRGFRAAGRARPTAHTVSPPAQRCGLGKKCSKCTSRGLRWWSA